MSARAQLLLTLVVVLLYSAAVCVLGRELDRSSIELALRLQARLSFALYVAALITPALPWRVDRSAMFRGFALSHLVHGVWIVLFFQLTDEVFSWSIPDLSGVLMFPMLAILLAGESLPLGALWARIRHVIVAYAWVQFVGFFVDRFFQGRPELRPWYVLAMVIAIVAAWIAWRWRAGRVAAPAS
jgi:hypothetical protein